MNTMPAIIFMAMGWFILTGVPVHSQTHPYTIVGTGVTKCYGNTAEITCPTNPSDSFYGQYQGITPTYQDNGNGTITDLNTGLIWIKARGSKTTWDSTFIKAAQCITGGYNDWRLPHAKELQSIVDYTLEDVHGAGAQRSDPKSGSPTEYFLGYDQQGHPVYGRGPQGDVIRINNYVRLVRDVSTSAVIENNNDHSLNIYPNPVSDLCTISLGRVYCSVHVMIFNALGLKVRDFRFAKASAADMDLAGLPSGIFIVNLVSDGCLATQKIIKL